MMPKQYVDEIMKSLANDSTLEMTDDDLEQLLNTELNKPADVIDTVLVQEILKAMNAPDPDPNRMKADWPIVKRHLPHRQARKRRPQSILRIGTAAAVVIAIMFVSLRDAEAFRWTLIQKLFIPVAETFGIVIDDSEDVTPEKNDTTLYTVEDAPSDFTQYAALEDVPEKAHGYLIRPKWIPQGFSLTGGSLYSSIGVDIYSMDFMSSEKWFNFYIHVYTVEETVYSYEFERNLDIPIETTVGQHHVTFYSNADDEFQSAFWFCENAHYRLVGSLTVDEIMSFIEHME